MYWTKKAACGAAREEEHNKTTEEVQGCGAGQV